MWTVHEGLTWPVRPYLRRLPVVLGVAARIVAGHHRVIARGLRAAAVQPGECVLDIGCGPAVQLRSLPPVRYYGFDLDRRAIDYARYRFGDRGEFLEDAIDEHHLPDLPPVDVVLLLGMLRRLDDQGCLDLLDLCARALGPDGRVISVDPCFDPGIGRGSRWLAGRDHGRVRAPHALAELAHDAFTGVDAEVLTGVTRAPSAYVLMRLHTPTASLARS